VTPYSGPALGPDWLSRPLGQDEITRSDLTTWRSAHWRRKKARAKWGGRRRELAFWTIQNMDEIALMTGRAAGVQIIFW
jgi:hypothetical protein